MALIEIDGLPSLPIKNGGSFHGYVSHNQRVTTSPSEHPWLTWQRHQGGHIHRGFHRGFHRGLRGRLRERERPTDLPETLLSINKPDKPMVYPLVN